MLGRELYSLALEFYMFTAEKPLDRLAHVRHLILTHQNTREDLEKKIEGGKKTIEKWKTEVDEILYAENTTNSNKEENRKRAEELMDNILEKLNTLPPDEKKKNS